MTVRFSILALLLLAFAACERVEDPFQLPPDDTAAYYPIEIGKFWEYVVDSTTFNENLPVPVSRDTYYVKEIVTDTFLDLEQHPWYRIERFERTSDTLPWEIKQVVAATIRDKEALRLENDLTFAKLIFPLKPFVKWDGNKYFDPYTPVPISGQSVEMFNLGWEYQVISIGNPEVIEGIPYEEVAVIQQADLDDDQFIKRFAREKYARGIGLVERELWILDNEDTTASVLAKPWIEKAQKGFILKQTLVRTN